MQWGWFLGEKKKKKKKKKGKLEVRYRESKKILEKHLGTEGSEKEGLGLRKEKTH